MLINLISIKAFFDRTGINYNDYDIKSLFNRLDNNKDGKICFNDLKNLFDLSTEIINSKNPLMKSLSGPIEPEVQYECKHLSRSPSPVRRTSENNLKVVYSPNIRNENDSYKTYFQHKRQTSIERSQSRSHSRSSGGDYQSPGNDFDRMDRRDDNNELFYESRGNRFMNSITYQTH